MDKASAPGTRTSRRFSALVILAGLLLGAAVGLALGVRTAGTYTARATVLVSPLDGNPYSPNGNGEDLVNLETEAQLAASLAVADLVAKDVGAPSAGRLLDDLKVEVPSNTQIVEITYRAGQASVAERRAESFATAYLAVRVNRADSLVAGRAATIQRQVDTQTRQLATLVRRKNAATAQVQRLSLQEQIDGVTKQIAKLRTALIGVRTLNADPGQVISPARVVSRDPQLTRWLFAGAGSLAGLAAAALVIVTRTRATGYSGPLPEPVPVPVRTQPVERPTVQQPQNV